MTAVAPLLYSLPQNVQDLLGDPGATQSAADPVATALVLAENLAYGGLAALFLRLLYRLSARPSSTESIARVFPMLTIVTVAVITVVKSSVALSLGLVGALSIVRFRAAIKDPEELVYLFLCIGIGLALGAELRWVAGTLLVVASGFAILNGRLLPNSQRSDAWLGVSGDAARYFGEGEQSALAIVRAIHPRLTLQRCEIENGEGELRLQLHGVDPAASAAQLAQIQARLPDCRISYVNAAGVA